MTQPSACNLPAVLRPDHPTVTPVGDRVDGRPAEPSPFAFPFFILLNAVLFLRPSELLSSLQDLPLYEVLIILCVWTSRVRLLDQLRPTRLARNPITICVMALLPAVALSHLSHFYIWGARTCSVEFGKIVIYYLLVVANLSTAARLRQFLLCLLGFAVFLTTLSVLQYHDLIDLPVVAPMAEAQPEIDPDTGTWRVLMRLSSIGLFGNPNDLARFIILGIVIAAHWLLNARSSAGRLFLSLSIALLAYALYLTSSRGGFLALLGGLGALFVYRFGWRKALPAAVLGLPVLLVLFSSRITKISTSEGTGQARIQFWSQGMELVQQAPVFGIGMNEFAERIHHAAHNTFMQYYVELGFLGGSLFLIAFGLATYYIYRLRLCSTFAQDSEIGMLRPCAGAVLVVTAAGLLTANRAYCCPTYAVIGIGAAYLSLVRTQLSCSVPVFSPALVARWMLISALSVIVLYLYIRFSVRWSNV